LEFGIGVREPVVLYAGQSTPLTYPRYFVECPHVGSRSLAATSNLKLEERAGLLQIVWTLPGNLRTHVYMYEHLTRIQGVCSEAGSLGNELSALANLLGVELSTESGSAFSRIRALSSRSR
jgi:hypothetical protein